MNERANYFSCSVSFIHSSVVRRQPPSDVVPSLSAPCSYVHPKKMTLHPSSACLHKVRLTRRSEKASVSETGGETVQDTHVRDWLWFKRKLLKRGNNTNIRFIYFFTTFYRPFILTYLFESTCLQHRPAPECGIRTRRVQLCRRAPPRARHGIQRNLHLRTLWILRPFKIVHRDCIISRLNKKLPLLTRNLDPLPVTLLF